MDQHDYAYLARRVKLLAHPERLRILDALRRGPECVCHLEALLQRPQPYVSQQVRTLYRAGALSAQKQGTRVFYRVIDQEILSWLDAVLGPLAGGGVAAEPRRRVKGCQCPRCTTSRAALDEQAEVR